MPQNNKSRSYGDREETIINIISEYSKLVQRNSKSCVCERGSTENCARI